MNRKNITLNILLLISLIVLMAGYFKQPKKEHLKTKGFDTNQTLPFKKTPDTIHIIRATTYNPVSSQCDNDPLTTADGSKIDLISLQRQEIRWVALSRDLLCRWGGPFNYGDTISVFSIENCQINGDWIVHDCMNARYDKSIDFLFDANNNYPKLGVGEDIKLIIRENG